MISIDALPFPECESFTLEQFKFLNAISVDGVGFDFGGDVLLVKPSLHGDGFDEGLMLEIIVNSSVVRVLLPESYVSKCFSSSLSEIAMWPHEFLRVNAQLQFDRLLNYLESVLHHKVTLDQVYVAPMSSVDVSGFLSLKFGLLGDVNDVLVAMSGVQYSAISNSLIEVESASIGCDVSDLILDGKLSVGSTRLNYAAVKNIDIGDVIIIDTHNVSENIIMLNVSGHYFWIKREDSKKFSIQKKVEEVRMQDYEDSKSGLDLAENVEFDLDFICGRKKIKVSDLQVLNQGYIFEIDRDVSSLVVIEANGKKIGEGRLVEVDNKIGVQVVNVLQSRKPAEVSSDSSFEQGIALSETDVS